MENRRKPSKAQIRYLKRAAEIESVARGGVYWLLWLPGRTSTGRICFREGWIRRVIGGNGLYYLTDAGRAILKEHPDDRA